MILRSKTCLSDECKKASTPTFFILGKARAVSCYAGNYVVSSVMLMIGGVVTAAQYHEDNSFT